MSDIKQYLLNMKSNDWIFVFVCLTFFLLPTGTAPPLISIALALLVWMFSGKIFQVRTIIVQPWFWPVIPFLLLPWIGLLYSQNLDIGLDYAEKTKYWFIIFLIAGLELNEKRIFFIFKSLWAGLFMGALLAAVQFLGVLKPSNELFLGFGIAHTMISLYLIVGILMVSFFYKKAIGWENKWWLLCLIAAFVFHLAVLRGRAGYLVFLMLSPIIANNLMHKFSLITKVCVSIILAGSLLASPVARKVTTDTWTNMYKQKEELLKGENVTLFPRPFMIREAIHIIKDHPVIGAGTGSMIELTKDKGLAIHHPHNNFLYMAVSYGIFGVIAIFWFFIYLFKSSWSKRDTALGYFVFYSGIVLFLGGMLDTLILNTGTLLLLALTYGMMNHIGLSE